jgi:Flp pilus assembly secretin CpaC
MVRHHRIILAAILATTCLPAFAASQDDDRLPLWIDHAQVMKLDRAAETVIIGNPSIVDVTVHDSTTLVLTGRSFGITNLIIIDRDGKPIIDQEIAVQSDESGTVRVFRQSERTTLACLTTCEPTVTIGDNETAFSGAAGQFNARQAMASGTAK